MYGIIAAMQEEMKEIKKIMQNIENKEIYELNFFKGTINDKNVVLVEAGVGKVNAARVTQILIDNFKDTRLTAKAKKINKIGENPTQELS